MEQLEILRRKWLIHFLFSLLSYHGCMSDEEDKKPKHPLLERLNAARNFLLALTALVTAVSAWWKPQDQTATKNSYEWSAAQIEKLAANDVKLQEDLVGLRNYIQGYALANGGRMPTAPEPTEAAGQGAGFGSGAGSLGATPQARRRRPPRAAGATASAVPQADPVEAFSEPELQHAIEHELPMMQAAPRKVEAPKFEELTKQP